MSVSMALSCSNLSDAKIDRNSPKELTNLQNLCLKLHAICLHNIIINQAYNSFAINVLNINWLDQYFC